MGKLQKQRIAETDERNISIANKARSVAFSVHVMLGAVAVIILSLFNMHKEATLISYSIFGLMFIYWICYFIFRKKD